MRGVAGTDRARRRAPIVLAAAVAVSSVLVALPAVAEPPRSADDSTTAVVQVIDGEVQAANVTSGQLAELRADPDAGPVVARGHTVQAAIATSVATVGAPAMWTQGQRGAGKVIVVVDTGVEPSFGGTLVGQACFAANQSGTVGYCGASANAPAAFDGACFALGVCGGADVLDPSAARPCPSPSTPATCAHGTAVAAVATRHEAPAGVAPDAGVYAIRVFDPEGNNADLVDVLLALDHVAQLSDAGMDIAAVNLSISTRDAFVGACDSNLSVPSEAFRLVFDQLLARDIPPVVASGNGSSHVGIGFPGCISNAVSVGSSDLDDELADFGNRGAGLDLLAPGASEGNGNIIPLVIPGGAVTSWAGTSFSAPHVAGAFALLAEAYPKASAGQRLALLTTNGVPVTESGRTYPRLLVGGGTQMLRGGRLFPDREPVVPGTRAVVGDLDGDGRDDLLIHGAGGGPDGIYFGRSAWELVRTPRTIRGSYRPIVGNFRGNPRTGAAPTAEEVLFYAAGSSPDPLWQVGSGRTITSSTLRVDATYASVVADLDGDGWDDIIWYAAGTTLGQIWFGGRSAFAAVSRPVTGRYRVAVGDFDCDGHQEVHWHAPGATQDRRWDVQANRSIISSAAEVSGSFRLAVGNLDGDSSLGHPCDDIVMHAPGAPTDHILYGGPNGTLEELSISGDYQPQVGDLNADGRAEVIWYAAGATGDVIWSVAPTRERTSTSMQVAGTYEPLVADLDGDGASDVVWHAPGTTVPLWWGVPGPP